MRVLVIGACGYVGSLVCPLLAPRHALRLFDLKSPAAEPANFLGFHSGNVGDSEAHIADRVGGAPPTQPLRLLFVGGDFIRKGGKVLLDAFQRLSPSINATLHLITNAPEAPEDLPNVRVYRNVAPNSEKLLNLFRQADVFIFPTQADCLGVVVLEAMAAGLPIITTYVGALNEAVIHGQTGLLVPPNDSDTGHDRACSGSRTEGEV